MEIKIIRNEFLEDRTFGELFINGKPFCYTVEDVDRNLDEDMSSSEIKKIKVAKQTCIPYGRYRVILSYSTKLKRYLPLLLDVPAWVGIRIHKGSGPNYSSGCPCVGYARKKDRLTGYKEAERDLVAALDKVNKTQAIYITIEKSKDGR